MKVSETRTSAGRLAHRRISCEASWLVTFSSRGCCCCFVSCLASLVPICSAIASVVLVALLVVIVALSLFLVVAAAIRRFLRLAIVRRRTPIHLSQ